MHRFFLKCRTVAFCSGVFFYRQDNAAAVTKKPSPSQLDAADASLRLWHLILENGFGPEVHGPVAMRSLRTVIRAQAMIDNTPYLAGETGRVSATWRAMQASAAFQASLAAPPAACRHLIRSRIYRRAARSYACVRVLSRVSVLLSRRKSM